MILTVTCPACQAQRTKDYGSLRAAELQAAGLFSRCPSCAGKQGGRARRKIKLLCGMDDCAKLQLTPVDDERYRCDRCGLLIHWPRK